jgi:hypothetical protein
VVCAEGRAGIQGSGKALINPGTLKTEFTGIYKMGRINQISKRFFLMTSQKIIPRPVERELFGEFTRPLFYGK